MKLEIPKTPGPPGLMMFDLLAFNELYSAVNNGPYNPTVYNRILTFIIKG